MKSYNELNEQSKQVYFKGALFIILNNLCILTTVILFFFSIKIAFVMLLLAIGFFISSNNSKKLFKEKKGFQSEIKSNYTFWNRAQKITLILLFISGIPMFYYTIWFIVPTIMFLILNGFAFYRKNIVMGKDPTSDDFL